MAAVAARASEVLRQPFYCSTAIFTIERICLGIIVPNNAPSMPDAPAEAITFFSYGNEHESRAKLTHIDDASATLLPSRS